MLGGSVLDPLLGERCVGCGRWGSSLCRRCERLLVPPAVVRTGIIAPWAYHGPARALILDLKLRGDRRAAAPLAAGMARAAWRHGVSATAIVWVPGRRSEIRRRGFDHAELLASRVATRLGLPPLALLTRRRDTPDQASLGARDRRTNLAGAFESRRFSGRVLLVDDLVTTGTTATACIGALRAAGGDAEHVLVACLHDRSPPPRGMTSLLAPD